MTGRKKPNHHYQPSQLEQPLSLSFINGIVNTNNWETHERWINAIIRKHMPGQHPLNASLPKLNEYLIKMLAAYHNTMQNATKNNGLNNPQYYANGVIKHLNQRISHYLGQQLQISKDADQTADTINSMTQAFNKRMKRLSFQLDTECAVFCGVFTACMTTAVVSATLMPIAWVPLMTAACVTATAGMGMLLGFIYRVSQWEAKAEQRAEQRYLADNIGHIMAVTRTVQQCTSSQPCISPQSNE